MRYLNAVVITISCLFMLFSQSILAQSTSPKVAYDYSEMAKNRTYIGGPEESDLKLLPESYFQKNKKTTNSEETSEGF